jgi:hypothetical protein
MCLLWFPNFLSLFCNVFPDALIFIPRNNYCCTICCTYNGLLDHSEAISLLFFSSYLAAYQVYIRTYYFTYLSIDPVESIYPVFLNTFLSKISISPGYCISVPTVSIQSIYSIYLSIYLHIYLSSLLYLSTYLSIYLSLLSQYLPIQSI